MDFAIKICGTTTRDDALYALEAGADYIGFILYPESPRCISPLALAQLMDQTEELDCAVGVFVNTPAQDLSTIAHDCNLCAIQLHGDEQPDDYAQLTQPVWRAVKLRDQHCLPPADEWPDLTLVVDADVPGHYGGTGQTADWTAAAQLASQRSVMLAGGLTPDNVGDAIRTVLPFGVDVASGTETHPGHKDRQKMKQFIAHARRVASEVTQT
ncbi:MAG: phosphoribosylanthranilate isomerase [Candidatus Promineifilaceae bacterium]|jgi:phosphoribosylanthranilate isomerase